MGAPLPHSLIGDARPVATNGVNALKRVYVFGGGKTQVYDPETDNWAFGADTPSKHLSFGVAVVNDLLYVIGGFTETFDMFWNSDVTLYATNEQYTPFGYGTPDPSYDGTAPEITVTSPTNKTYYTADVGVNFTNVALNFTVDEPVFSVRLVLDGGVPVEVSGNMTIAELAVGVYNVTVFGFDASGNMGTSETICFAIEAPEPFPTTFAAASVITVSVVGIGLLVYFKKRKH